MTNEDKLREYLRQVIAKLRQAHQRLAELADRDREPLAIVGMGCRYPGGIGGPPDLWELVAAGRDAITEFPADRGWDTGDLSYSPRGGFVAGAGDFDAAFFGISPREALAMDPQQRLLLEVSWEALERAGIDPLSLRGSRTGVFAGAASSGYGAGLEDEESGGYLLTGGSGAVISGRVSYVLGLEGPAVTVDTACSSSLVTLHLAGQALRAQECDLALAGGVTVMVTPGAFTEFSRQGGLAADGRCKPFAAAADGVGWSEGAGMLVLERLADARRNGHEVLAVVAGSAVNQDGASNGLTAPNGPSQQRVIRAALAAAGLRPDEVDAVEAHGTGTTLGDPIEAQALLATYGQDRDRPLWLGSVKSNIGHAQTAAGVAGVIKMVLALRHGVLPPTLHADEPSPHVNWAAGEVRLLAGPVPWPAGGHPRRAAVSAFGVSGTNAHLIVAEAPAQDQAAGDGVPEPAGHDDRPRATGLVPWLVSGRTAEGLAAQAERLAGWVTERPELDPADVAWSLATSRSSFGHRAVVLGADREELLAGLAAVAAGERGAVAGEVRPGDGARVGFLFAGQGSQRAGMGRELHAASPVFAAAFDRACARLEAELGVPVAEVVLAQDEDERADQTVFAQAGLLAVGAGLVALLASCGVTPDAVAGHSVGEVTAAYAAGVLSLEDACRLVAARARLMQALPDGGAMTAIAATEAEVAVAIRGVAGVSVAAVNGPSSVVISGDAGAVERVAEPFRAAGVRVKSLRVSHAFHSHRMDPVLEELGQVAARLEFAVPRVPWACALSGELVTEPEAGYWPRQAREPVRFAAAVAALAAQEISVFLEIGPDGTLSALGPAALGDGGEGGGPGAVFVPVLRPGQPAAAAVTAALARAHVHGAVVDWAAVLGSGRRVDLPTYAFRHQRYWPRPVPPGAGDVAAAGLGAVDHPLLGAGVELAAGEGYLLTGRLSRHDQPWLADHGLAGHLLVPGTAFVEMAIRAGDAAGCGRVDELTLAAPLVLSADGAVQVQVVVGGADEGGRRTVELYSRPEGAGAGERWTRHASGRLAPAGPPPAGLAPDLAVWPPAGAVPADTESMYEALAAGGYRYGPAFRGLRAAWRRGGDIFAEVALTGEAAQHAGSFGMHPALLDAALHPSALAGTSGRADGGPGVPFSWAGVTLYAAGASALRVRLRRAADGALSLVAADEAGVPAVSVESLTLRPVPDGQLETSGAAPGALFAVEWMPAAMPPAVPPGGWAVLGAAAPDLVAGLAGAGVDVRVYPDPAALAGAGGPVPEVVLTYAGTGDRAAGPPAAARAEVGRVLGLIQQWLSLEVLGSSRLVVVTQGAVAALAGEDVTDLAGAAVWGLVRSAQSENPGRLTLADLPAGGHGAGTLAALGAGHPELAGEPELAVRDGRLLGRRLVRPAAVPPEPRDDRRPGARDARTPGTRAPRDAGTVLVTGGTGLLGGLVAGHLAGTGRARVLVLASRSGPAASGAADLAAGLARAGAAVQLAACDAGDRDAVAGLLARVPGDTPLTGVVHTAGVLDDGVTESLTPERVDAVMRPKADAAWHLHELTQDASLDTFVLFSSAAAAFGSAGQANYAAANAFLDGLAARRRTEGRPGVSLAWGPWADASGMTGQLSDLDRSRMARGGVTPLTAGEGLALLDQSVVRDQPMLVAARLDPARLSAIGRTSGLPPLLSRLVEVPARPAASPAASRGPGLSAQLAEAGPDGQEQVLTDLVRNEAATVLGHSGPGAVPAEAGFLELGLDSLTAVELRNRLNEATGLRLPATVAFDHPTPLHLARQLRAQLGTGQYDTGQPGTGQPGSSAEPPGAPPTRFLGALYARAAQTGQAVEIMRLIQGLAAFRPVFTGPGDLGRVLRPAPASRGAAAPAVVCLPSFVGRPHEYARLAARFRGIRPVSVIPAPGFAAGEPLPATFSALIDVQAEAIMSSADGMPYVLAGHSSGGLAAHALATRLESTALAPVAVVLMDTYDAFTTRDVSALETFWSILPETVLAQPWPQETTADDAWLTAMAHYFSLDREGPAPTGLPTLLVRARPPAAGPRETAIQERSWTYSARLTVVDVPGDHFTMMSDHAATTAQAVEDWLTGL
jgi:acyl transferase domain-containing protein/thioesterase domain-containing protein/acyl carrier protein